MDVSKKLWTIYTDGFEVGNLTGYTAKEAESKARLIWKLQGNVKAEPVAYNE